LRVLITGGCGFIGHHVVEHILKMNPSWEVVIFDKLNYASNGFDRLRDISVYDDKRVTVMPVDFTQPISEGVIKELGNIYYILHMGAETHVDNSIDNAEPFVMSNVVGTMHMLELARKIPTLNKFCYFSTDEVFGPAPNGVRYKEWDRYDSTNPYSASKAGGEELCLAYANTYRVPLFITHTMNVFGERQHQEKFIPMCIRKIRDGKEVTIHSDEERKVSGSRFYRHARNVASAITFLLGNSEQREKYNIVGELEVSNLKMAQVIAGVLGKKLKYKMVDFHTSRPGHDLRYALDGTKLKEMGYEHPREFEESLAKTVLWYINNPKWLEI